MRLTEHFSFEEFVKTSFTDLQDENIKQAANYIDNMMAVATELEKPRGFLAKPVIILSGFRFDKLNERVGGVPNSQHKTAAAVDFTVKDFSDPAGLRFVFDWCSNHTDYGQIILELKRDIPWIHWGLPRPGQPKKKLIFEDGVYKTVI